MSSLQVPAPLAPFQARWRTFVEKIRARLREIENEAMAGYREVIQIDVVDGTGVTGVTNALRARLIALERKVDDAYDKLDNEMQAVDVDGEDDKAVRRFHASMLSEKAALGREVERMTETIVVYGEAEAARALHAVALEEARAPLPCGNCNAPLQRPSWHDTVNVTCPHCRAVTTSTPGTAGMMFAKGAGAIALAFEAALGAWYARQDAEAAWHRLRHKTLDDLARWEAANRHYWQTFAEGMARYHPGWTAQTIADEVRGKMSQFMEHDAKNDRAVRENLQAGFAAVGTSDPAQVHAWLGRQRDSDSARGELIEAFLERGWTDHARWIAQVTGLPADDFAELQEEVANRGE
jgi:hypothetical protein